MNREVFEDKLVAGLVGNENAFDDIYKELSSWKEHGLGQKEIDRRLHEVSKDLHERGLLPGVEIVGFEKGSGRLIMHNQTSDKGFTLDKEGHQLDFHKNEITDGFFQKQEGQSKDAHGKVIDEMRENYGVEIRERDGKIEYVVHPGGREQILFTGHRGVNSYLEAGDAMRSMANNRMNALHEDFNVNFSKPNSIEQVHDAEGNAMNVRTREPRFDELDGVTAALFHTDKIPQIAKENIKIVFAQEKQFPDDISVHKEGSQYVIVLAPGFKGAGTEAGSKPSERGHTVQQQIEDAFDQVSIDRILNNRNMQPHMMRVKH